MKSLSELFTQIQHYIESAIDNHKKRMEKKRLEIAEMERLEEERQEQITSGKIKPIRTSIQLMKGEVAYAIFPAQRMALVEQCHEITTGKSKKSGGIGRALVGGVLLGPAGAIVGASTASSKVNTKTHQIRYEKKMPIDEGDFLLTNQRILFIGKQIVSIPYEKIIGSSFQENKNVFSRGYEFEVKYEEMMKGESYFFKGDAGEDVDLYFEGITENLLS